MLRHLPLVMALSFFVCLFRQGIAMQAWLAWKSLCTPGCPPAYMDSAAPAGVKGHAQRSDNVS